MSPLLAMFNGLGRPTRQKAERCREILQDLGRVVVAYSGGVDSSTLLAMAIKQLGVKNAIASLIISPLVPQQEVDAASLLLAQLGAECELIRVDELTNPQVIANPPRRCYHCKRELFQQMLAIAQRVGGATVVSGDNADDVQDYRPGMQALKELGVRSPLMEAGLTKNEIRAIAKQLGLPNWDTPSTACLASRIPYGRPITAEKLRRVENAEIVLHQMGFEICRVRDYDELARVELPAEDFDHALAQRQAMVDSFKQLGYAYVTLDLTGFRSGSMNEALRDKD